LVPHQAVASFGQSLTLDLEQSFEVAEQSHLV
jgi:hypothetical protein